MEPSLDIPSMIGDILPGLLFPPRYPPIREPNPYPYDELAKRDKENRDKQEALDRQRAEAAQDRIRQEMELSRTKAEADKRYHNSMIEIMNQQRQKDAQRHLEDMKREQMLYTEKEAREREFRKELDAERETARQKMDAMEKNARERADRAQRETNDVREKSEAAMLANREKLYAELERSREESEKRRETLRKEHQQVAIQKEREAEAKLEKLNKEFNDRISAEKSSAKDREEKNRLEKTAMEKQYRKDMESISNKSYEERKRHEEAYHAFQEKKDKELNEIRDANLTQLDAIRTEHHKETEKARETLKAVQDKHAQEIRSFHEEHLKTQADNRKRESALFDRMIHDRELSHKEALASAHAMCQLRGMFTARGLEYEAAAKSNSENTPLREQKIWLSQIIQNCSDTWMNLTGNEHHADSLRTKMTIKNEADFFRKEIVKTRNLITVTTNLSNLVDWKNAFNVIEAELRDYCKSVRTEIETASVSRLNSLSDLCEKLRVLIVNLPEVPIEDLSKITRDGHALMEKHGRRSEMEALRSRERLEGLKHESSVTDEKYVEHHKSVDK